MSFDSGNMNVTITMIDSSGLLNTVRPNMTNMAFDFSNITQNI
jgi:hypothetical protein